ncbi:retron system putative HNH endonuclease [Spiroplasma endosymbiont of Nebria brevicollis]|uniref:retron system putative HNH endonuclease n=1 Tax=Spiroplasma endosymbiont of Nebria brevicollis TaxID=3066284 RepID=UPI00313DF886
MKIKQKLKEYILEKEQKFIKHYFCCYCNRFISLINTHLEHFLPRDFFKNQQFSYSNIFVSCNDKKTCGHFKENKETSILNPSKDIFADYLEYKISDNGIEIVSKNNLGLKYKKICEDTIKILNLNERRLVNYRMNLYIQHVRKKVPFDYAEIHPILMNFLKKLQE